MQESISGNYEYELRVKISVHEDMAVEKFYSLVVVLVPFRSIYYTTTRKIQLFKR